MRHTRLLGRLTHFVFTSHYGLEAEMVARTLGYIEEEMKSENAWRTTLDWNPNSEGGWGKRFMLIWHGILPKSVL